ncbi:heparan-alpha-glucosaminide N-acetyltransferase domain-containing protein [Mucilaginibacter koreensis]
MKTAVQTPDPVLATPVKKRIDSIDVLRGLVMVLMALDHTRDFCSRDTFDASNLTQASTPAFLTRFITHFCAACFVFLAGTGAYLLLKRGKTKRQAAEFLISRGLWLILLEFTVLTFGFTLQLPFTFGFMQVIWAIGVSMIVLAGLVYLPMPVIAAFAFILIAGHNLLDGISTESLPQGWQVWWQLLHNGGRTQTWFGMKLWIIYPLIPWVGVMAAGYCFGIVYKMDAQRRRKLLLSIGSGMILLFIVLRSGNFYGDSRFWQPQENMLRSTLSFINVQKYPPSLLYVLVTLGPALIFLALVEPIHNKLTRIMVVFGRVPLFYYLLHIYLLRIFSGALLLYSQALHTPYGVGLGMVYVLWLLAVIILYFPCRWFMRIRAKRNDWWLSYL